jgi:hypothetical protein
MQVLKKKGDEKSSREIQSPPVKKGEEKMIARPYCSTVYMQLWPISFFERKACWTQEICISFRASQQIILLFRHRHPGRSLSLSPPRLALGPLDIFLTSIT